MNLWIKTELAIAIHNRQIAEHGGLDGVRDIGLLESALARPQNIAAYEANPDIARLAAAYAYGILSNHPFLDGNKRTGYVVMETYIIKNGFDLSASPAEKYLTFIKVAESTMTEADLTKWLRERIR